MNEEDKRKWMKLLHRKHEYSLVLWIIGILRVSFTEELIEELYQKTFRECDFLNQVAIDALNGSINIENVMYTASILDSGVEI